MRTISAKELVKEMNLGWNLGNTMDSVSDKIDKTSAPEAWETAWANPVTTKELIEKLIDEGFNVIRYPVSWRNHIGEAPEYKIDTAWMDRVQELVDWAYNQGAFVIANMHHEGWHDPYYDNLEPASAKFRAVWKQIAERFIKYDEHLIFEGMNEPRKCGTPVEWTGGDQEGWDVVNALNKVFVDTVRSTGGNNVYRSLMIPGYAANCTVGIRHLEIPEGDNHIIASVHAYEPVEFALMVEGRGLWNRDTKDIDQLEADLEEIFLSKGIPVIIGECGAMHRPVEGNEVSRADWAEYFFGKMKRIGVPCAWWDNGYTEGHRELFSLIDRKTLTWQFPVVLEGIRKGLEAK